MRQKQLNIAFLTNVLTNGGASGGAVHVSQVGNRLIGRGHRLYTNLQDESDLFEKLSEIDFIRRGREIDVFYIRIHGWPENDELTLLRRSNIHAPCVWEVNAPLEEMRTLLKSEGAVQRGNIRRRQLARMVDAAICVSDEMEEYARNELGIERTYTIPNGSDTGLFSPEKRDDRTYGTKRFKILWSGSPQYRWQGLRKVQELSWKLKEKGMDDVLLIATADGVSSENLTYLGAVPYAEMPRYMASADAGLCIYENIGFYSQFYFSPLKLYDYMASGIPVIGTNAGQIRRVIEEQQNGLLTDNSVEDLIDKITFLKNHPGDAREMGMRGRRSVLASYNWANVASKTESVLLGMIEICRPSLKNISRSGAAAAGFHFGRIVMIFKFYSSLLRKIFIKSRKSAMGIWSR